MELQATSVQLATTVQVLWMNPYPFHVLSELTERRRKELQELIVQSV